jgi:hypothetical protein
MSALGGVRLQGIVVRIPAVGRGFQFGTALRDVLLLLLPSLERAYIPRGQGYIRTLDMPARLTALRG